MTFAEAAEAVLRDQARPMTVAEITDVALARGWLKPSGRTPVATMSAALYGLPQDSPIKRLFEPAVQRAKRGSVRWVLTAD